LARFTEAKTRPQKSPRKKPVATTRSTAGPGYEFEDFVSAWLLVKMLTGEAMPGLNLQGTYIQSQTAALGWTIDDLLVGANNGYLAISCKSNVQVSANGLPDSFVQAVWMQNDNSGPASEKTTHFALVTRGSNMTFEETWADIKTWCSEPDATLALARINESPKHLRVFDSVTSPSGDKHSGTEAVKLIHRLHVLPVDFQLAQSTKTTESILRCRELLRDGTSDEAGRLWENLRDRARNARLGGGTITLTDLWRSLRMSFALKHHPNYEPSWNALNAITADYKSGISTTLPNGVSVGRETEISELRRLIDENIVSVVYGESGVGKSALVQLVLDQGFRDAVQVWMGPEQLALALSETKRRDIGLTYPLLEVLRGSNREAAVLVIDAAEHLPTELTARVKQLIAGVLSAEAANGFKVIVVGQASWASSGISTLLGPSPAKSLSIAALSESDVSTALLSTQNLRWLAGRTNVVAALTNLRALGWVIEADGELGGDQAQLTSQIAIADLLWEHWTGGKAALQRFMIRLARREASFERSFAISELEDGEANTFDARPATLPLRKNTRRRIEFEHDLAADWARFQYLKEIADDIAAWAQLATNPLWHNALRLLGQMFLRETKSGKSAWDTALAAVEKMVGAPLAVDLLLDAVFTDPEAESFLNQKADLLFENHGERLNRLLRRFHYIATVPNFPIGPIGLEPSLRLYFDAQFRMPIVSYWPAMARFLTSHSERAVALLSSPLAMICETWLKNMPKQLGSVPTPFRQEFAAIALAAGRALQLELRKHRIYFEDSEEPIFVAALAAADDLPEHVAEFALEMARRRTLRKDLTEAVNAHRLEEQKKREERNKADPERAQQRRSVPFLSSRTKLPPWPLGPQARVEQKFSEVCTHSGGLASVMRATPHVAAEVLLAVIIDGEPEEEDSRAGLNDAFGLEFDMKSYPTSFWKSPFFPFLAFNADFALKTLLQLVDFCTERWADERARGLPPAIDLTLADGTALRFVGNVVVFDWVESSSHHSGQLNCALSALEKWLCLKLDHNDSIDDILDTLLRQSKSAGVLGVLVNVGKYRPGLFAGLLKPLLSRSDIYFWDDWRRKQGFRFDAMTWVRSGDAIFNMARDWAFAPHRVRPLRRVAAELVRSDATVAQFVAEQMRAWEEPVDTKSLLELDALKAELDPANYQGGPGHAESEGVTFVYPRPVRQRLAAYQSEHAAGRAMLFLPQQCREFLIGNVGLTDEQAKALASVLSSASPKNLDEQFKQDAVDAAAATLISHGSDWLERNPEIAKQAVNVVRASVSVISDTDEGLKDTHFRSRSGLQFAAHAVVQKLVEGIGDQDEWEEMALRIVTSRDNAAAATLMSLAHARRSELGPRWPRLVHFGILSAGLSVLSPGYDHSPAEGTRWARWLHWLRTRRLNAGTTGIADINLLAIARRVERFEQTRWVRDAAREEQPYGWNNRRQSDGLEPQFLLSAFSWLLKGSEPLDPDERNLLKGLWEFEAWHTYERREEPDRETTPTQLGYETLDRTAVLLPTLSEADAREHWLPVLSLGAMSHYSVRHFLSAWFLLPNTGIDVAVFIKHWRAMAEYALGAEKWTDGRQWFYGEQLLCQILGLGSDISFNQMPNATAVVQSMADLYERWADEHLASDENNVARFCNFLSTSAGEPLRTQALPWLVKALAEGTRASCWRRETGSAVLEYLDVILLNETELLIVDAPARHAAMTLTALLAIRQVKGALSLQERIGQLR
jgi:hypothetical protein